MTPEAADGGPDAPTVDGFHRGRFVLVQPARGAHRAGMDAMVLAAALPAGFGGHAYDFGAGAGAVGLALASRCPDARVTLVEVDAGMAGHAAATLARPENAALFARLSLMQADVAAGSAARHSAGLGDRSADAVLMNPPFNDPRDRASAQAARALAHVAGPDLFDAWLRAAAAVLVPGGHLAAIARPASLHPILQAMDGRFGDLAIVPLHPTDAEPAIRIVVRARKGRRGALSLLPPLILHETGSRAYTSRADAIINGQASLCGD